VTGVSDGGFPFAPTVNTKPVVASANTNATMKISNILFISYLANIG
jgi:hypothetical protein